ncbi:MAG: TIM-barrel domain-containing protein [Anaerolineaceae bacterium]
MTRQSQPKILKGNVCDTRILRLSPRAIRITHKSKDLAEFPPERIWFNDVLIGKSLPDRQKTLQVLLKDDCIQMYTRGGQDIFRETHPPILETDQRVTLSFELKPNEGLYGFGEWFNAFRRTEGKMSMATHDSPAILQHRQTYSTLPVYLSDRNYAVFILNSHRAEVSLDPKQCEIKLAFDGPPADYILITGENPKTILAEYTRLTGHPPLLSLWAYGLWVTGYPQESQAKVLELVAEHRTRRIPLDGVILDYHWEERFHNFKWRKSLFPDSQELIDKLRSLRVHLGLIFTPFVNHTNLMLLKVGLNLLYKNLPDGVEQDDERDLAGYNEAHSQGYFADNDTSWWFGKGGMIDFTNPGASDWWNERLKPLYRSGVSFFKNDDGEYLPLRAKSSNGMNGHEYHNLYGFYYCRALYDGMAKLDERRPLVYARSVWAGSQRYPAIFLGDQVPNFENIRRTMRAGLNMSLMGFAYWTADVFGLSGKTTPETHMRYAQWALFCPIARYFLRPDKIDKTRKPWSHSQQVLENFKRHVELRYRLLPYYHQLGWEAFLSGIPHMRPLLLEFPGDERLLPVYDQIMLGNALMLCPVTQSGARTRQVILPRGDWYDYWTDDHYSGSQTIELDAPIDHLPLLVRAGSILPMGPLMQFIPDHHRFDELELHFYPHSNGSITLHDDDPETRAYLRGEAAQTKVVVSSTGENIEVTIEKPTGLSRLVPPTRKLRLVFHDCKPVKQVRVNRQRVESWAYDPNTSQLIVNTDCRSKWGLKLEITFT